MVVPIEDLIFVVCTLIGGGLLLVTVLVDDARDLAAMPGIERFGRGSGPTTRA